MKLSLDTRKMVKDFGGLTACYRSLNNHGFEVSRDAVDKWRRRKSLSTKSLIQMAVIAKKTGKRFDLYDYIEIETGGNK